MKTNGWVASTQDFICPYEENTLCHEQEAGFNQALCEKCFVYLTFVSKVGEDET